MKPLVFRHQRPIQASETSAWKWQRNLWKGDNVLSGAAWAHLIKRVSVDSVSQLAAVTVLITFLIYVETS